MAQKYRVLTPAELILQLQSAPSHNSFIHSLGFFAWLSGDPDDYSLEKTSGGTKRAVRAALSGCREILLTRTTSTKRQPFAPKFKQKWIDDDALIRRLRRPWVRNMRRDFIDPLGGLVNVLSAPRLSSFDRSWSKHVNAHRGELAITEYLAKGFVENPALVNRTTDIQAAMRMDALGKGPAFYKLLAEKRQKRLESNAVASEAGIAPLIGMSDTQFYDKWKRVSVKTLATFLVNDLIENSGADHFFSDPETLERWSHSTELRGKLIVRLQLKDLLRPCLLKLKRHDIASWPTCPPINDTIDKAPRFNELQQKAVLNAIRRKKSWSKASTPQRP